MATLLECFQRLGAGAQRTIASQFPDLVTVPNIRGQLIVAKDINDPRWKLPVQECYLEQTLNALKGYMPIVTTSSPVPTSLNTTLSSTPIIPVPIQSGPTTTMPIGTTGSPNGSGQAVVNFGQTLLEPALQNQNNIQMPAPGGIAQTNGQTNGATNGQTQAAKKPESGGVNPMLLMAGAYYALKLFMGK